MSKKLRANMAMVSEQMDKFVEDRRIVTMGEIDVKEIETMQGQVLIKQGDPSDEMYILKKGKIAVYEEGKLVNIINEGEIFGEIAYLKQTPRSATLIVLEEGSVIRFNKVFFENTLKAQPEFIQMFIHCLLDKLLFKFRPRV